MDEIPQHLRRFIPASIAAGVYFIAFAIMSFAMVRGWLPFSIFLTVHIGFMIVFVMMLWRAFKNK